MIGMLAPVIFAGLKKAMSMFGMGRFDIPALLASQRSNIAAAMPEGMGEGAYTGPRVAARGSAPESRTEHTAVSDLRIQDGKLVLTGTAPNLRAANRVWDEIKKVDPSLNNVIVDIRAPATGTAE
jgi:hypothetical protein